MNKILTAIAAALLAAAPLAGATDNSDGLPTEAEYKALAARPHPRLIASSKDFARLKREIRKNADPSLAKAHSIQLHLADLYSGQGKRLEYRKDQSGRRILSVSRDALQRLMTLSYAWKTAPKKEYVACVEALLEDVCSFPDWNNPHFLDTAEMTAAVAIAYDWMYDALSPRIRALVEKTIAEYALADGIRRDYLQKCNNWNQVCNAGILCGAIAVIDSHKELAQRRIDEAIASNRPVMETMYEPDGTYPEGPDYWSYGTMFEILMLKALDEGFGRDFGLSCSPGFTKTGHYQLFSQSGTGLLFNYYDNGEKAGSRPEMWYFAARHKDRNLVRYEVEHLAGTDLENVSENDARSRLMPMYLFDMAKLADKSMPEAGEDPEDGNFFHGQGTTPIFIARYGWGSDNAYLAMKAGCAMDAHAHLDAGTFVYDAYGYRWASDLTRIAYSISEYNFAKYGASLWDRNQESWRWKICSYNNLYHNTLSVNGKLHVSKGRAALVDVFDTPECKGGTVDLKAVLSPDLTKAQRTASLHKDGALEVKDVVAAAGRPAFVRWTMVTSARAEVRDDGIHLFQGDVEMVLSASGADVRYNIWPGKESPSDNPVAEFDPGADRTVCGFTFIVPKRKEMTVTTQLRKL